VNLRQYLDVNNECYKAGVKFTPKGIMVHSTATKGVTAARYAEAWNVSRPGGTQKCVHAFLDGKEVIQTLPWTMRGWHAGGTANNTHIGFEMSEPAAEVWADKATFEKWKANALDLTEMLCRQFGLTEANVITHCEGRKLGIASNHADVMHWFPKVGYSMDAFRADLRKRLMAGSTEPPPDDPFPPVTDSYRDITTTPECYTIYKIAKTYGVPQANVTAPDGSALNPGHMRYGQPVRVWFKLPEQHHDYTWTTIDKTVYSLAKRYGVSWTTIRLVNTDGSLYIPPYFSMRVGMKLRIK